MTWQEKFESQFRWERRGGKNVRVRISDNTIISDKEYVKLYKTAQSDTATQRRESFGKEQFLDQFIWSDEPGPSGELQTRRQVKELNKSRLPLTINLKGGGTRTIHPSHPEYNKYKSGELKINNEFRLPGEKQRTVVEQEPRNINLKVKKGNQPVINNQAKIDEKEKAPLAFEQELAIRLKGVGQRDFKSRDAKTRALLEKSNLPSDLDSDTLRDIRIGHAWVTKSGAIRTNPSRGPSLLIKKKKKKEDE